jgi:hypothetical protein
MKHFNEERTCLNCGKTFIVGVHKEREGSRKVEFCPECIANLSLWERKKIKMSKIPEFKQKIQAGKRDEFERHIKKYMYSTAKIRAQKKGIPFDIEEDDIIIPKVCPILEVPLVLGHKGNYEYTPSLDRIDNSKGYVKGNIMVISKKANSMKNSASIEELKMFVKNVLRYSLNITENECSELQDKEPVR